MKPIISSSGLVLVCGALALFTIPLDSCAQFGSPTVLAYNALDPNAITHSSQIADFDNDGLTDILAFGRVSEANVGAVDSLEILWYRNLGADVYADPIPISAPIASTDLLVLDVNGDGLLDVVTGVPHSGTTLGLGYLLNMGNGLLSNEPVSLSLPTWSWTWAVNYVTSCIDIDGDMDKDVIVAMPNCQFGCIFWVVRNNGNGFDPPVSFNLGYGAVGTMAFGDIDSDNDIDIVIGHSSQYAGTNLAVGYLLNDGSGNFAAEVLVNMSYASNKDIQIRDMDMDGNNDIVVAKQTPVGGSYIYSVVIFRNYGGLAFAPPMEVAVRPGIFGAMALSDVNSDNYPDIMLSNYASSSPSDYCHILNNSGTGDLVFSDVDSIAIRALFIVDITTATPEFIIYSGLDIKLLQLPDSSTGWQVRQISDFPVKPNFTDWDGDGLTDLVEWKNNSMGLVWKRNEGNLQFSNAQLIALNAPAGPFNTYPVDIDADGNLDILVTSACNQDLTVVQNGLPDQVWDSTLFNLHVSSNCLSGARDINLLDVDMDGDTDLVFHSSLISYGLFDGLNYFRNDGSGALAFVSSSAVSNIKALRMVDLNEDGLQDGLYLADSPPRLLWSQNNGPSGFGSATLIQPCAMPTGGNIILADLDNDGRKDIVYMTYGPPGQVSWMKNTGGATFSNAQVILPIAVAQLSVADIDNDGDNDLVLHDQYSIAFARNLGNGVFEQSLTTYLQIEPGLGPAPLGAPYFQDLDNDGDMDMLYYHLNDLMLAKNYSSSSITGTVYIDVNGNSVRDTADVPAPYLPLVLSPEGSQPFTNGSGQYLIYADTGSYSLQCQGSWNPALWALNEGQAGHQFVLHEDDHLDSLNFGLTPLADSSLFEPSITLGTGTCGALVPLWISIKNMGTRIENGVIELALAEGYDFAFSSPAPISDTDNIVTWSFDSLSYFDVATIHGAVMRPSVVYMGDTLTCELFVSTYDSTAVTNVFHAEHVEVITCSYDPNSKTAAPVGYGDMHAVEIGQDHLDYTIHFQNLGTAAAQTVVIRDQLSALLNHMDFQVIGYSHEPTKISLDGDGYLKIEFSGIQLPPAGQNYLQSQGFMKFRIGIVPGLPHLTEIHNSASIYFDQNPPVVTDATLTTLVDCSLWSPVATELEPAVIHASDGDAYQWFLNDTILIGDTAQVLMADIIGTYSAVVTSHYGCVSVTNTVDIDSPLKIGEVKEMHVKLVPNPLSLETHLISVEVLSSDHRIEVIDPCGKVLQEYRGAGTRELVIQRRGLSAGIYIVQVYSGIVLCGSVRMVMY